MWKVCRATPPWGMAAAARPPTPCGRCSRGRRPRDGRGSRAATGVPPAPGPTGDVEGMRVDVAVGYGGRHEIANAVRSLLKEHVAAGRTVDQIADSLTEDDIAEHLYTKGQPDPDLVIRTSGEQRLGGF